MAVLAVRSEQDLLSSLEAGIGRRRRRERIRRRSHRLNAAAARRRRRAPYGRARARRTLRIGLERHRRSRASKTTSFVCPGITSILRFSSGTQRLWMTSGLVTRMSTGTPTGDMYLVRGPCPGGRVRDGPEPLSSRRRRLHPRLAAQGEVFGSASSVSTNSAHDHDRREDDAQRDDKSRSRRDRPPLGRLTERCRRRPITSSATTIANTIAEPTNMIHQRDEIVPAGPLCGESVDCPPPQPVKEEASSATGAQRRQALRRLPTSSVPGSTRGGTALVHVNSGESGRTTIISQAMLPRSPPG